MLAEQDRQTLLDVARTSVRYGLQYRQAAPVSVADYSPALQQQGASFVTLKIRGDLRGCIGTLAAHQSLVEDVAGNAYKAAFRDPRFPKLTASEFDQLHVHISVLTPPQPVRFVDEPDLLRQIQPHVDGLVLSDGAYRGTFLPSVWESLRDRQEFLRHLKVKAGLPPDYWSPTLRVERYGVEEFG
jgi:AmmeMemoRadiSam system protein A